MKYYRRSELNLDEEITTFKENIGDVNRADRANHANRATRASFYVTVGRILSLLLSVSIPLLFAVINCLGI